MTEKSRGSLPFVSKRVSKARGRASPRSTPYMPEYPRSPYAGVGTQRPARTELGLERRAVDAVFRALPVVVFEGYSRPMVTVRDYLELIEGSTYRGDRVRP